MNRQGSVFFFTYLASSPRELDVFHDILFLSKLARRFFFFFNNTNALN